MKNYFNLSKQAISVLKQIDLRWEIIAILRINDSRTIDKHIKNNFPDGPLMNYNIRELIKKHAPFLSDKDIYHKISREEMAEINERKKELKGKNAKYNNNKKHE
ncbi:hypothetical protein LJC53_02090 [Bacteroidales bacterium OttesenSCG-928-C03]|nr:hypothetical protein [Bacteroidales bacterium OttesenSCG-928-C03]